MARPIVHPFMTYVRVLLLGFVVLLMACASAGAPGTTTAAPGSCDVIGSCTASEEECADRWIGCEMALARTIASNIGPSEAFDSLASKLADSRLGSAEQRRAAARDLERYYPAVVADVNRAMTERRTLLALRRVLFLDSVFLRG